MSSARNLWLRKRYIRQTILLYSVLHLSIFLNYNDYIFTGIIGQHYTLLSYNNYVIFLVGPCYFLHWRSEGYPCILDIRCEYFSKLGFLVDYNFLAYMYSSNCLLTIDFPSIFSGIKCQRSVHQVSHCCSLLSCLSAGSYLIQI